VLDLGEEWHKMTGLPFVFAVWAGRKGCVTPEVTAAFLDSARRISKSITWPPPLPIG
jgi:predicted solute-binding protein